MESLTSATHTCPLCRPRHMSRLSFWCSRRPSSFLVPDQYRTTVRIRLCLSNVPQGHASVSCLSHVFRVVCYSYRTVPLARGGGSRGTP